MKCFELQKALVSHAGMSAEDSALLANRLQKLAGEHLALSAAQLNGKLDARGGERLEKVEKELDELVKDVPGIERLDFNGDPRGNASVSVVFTNGAANGFSTGLWKIFQD